MLKARPPGSEARPLLDGGIFSRKSDQVKLKEILGLHNLNLNQVVQTWNDAVFWFPGLASWDALPPSGKWVFANYTGEQKRNGPKSVKRQIAIRGLAATASDGAVLSQDFSSLFIAKLHFSSGVA